MEPLISRNIVLPLSLSARASKHVRRNSMTNRFLMSVAAAALIAGTGFANAQGTGQGTGMSHEAPSAGAATQSAPSADRAAPSASTPMNRDSASESKGGDHGMKSTQSDEKMPQGTKSQRA